MILETPTGFQHITDVMSNNAIATLFFFGIAVLSIKIVATLCGAMMRDDAIKMEKLKERENKM